VVYGNPTQAIQGACSLDLRIMSRQLLEEVPEVSAASTRKKKPQSSWGFDFTV
jgi:hypothetical protein